MWLYPRIIVSKSHENTSKYVDTVILFLKTSSKGPLTPSLLGSHVWLPKDHCAQVPWEYINVCGYSDQFCKIPHTTYIQNEWSHKLFLNKVQARPGGHHDSGSGIIFHKKSIGLHLILYTRLLKFWWLDMLYSILLWFIICRGSKMKV